MSPKTLSAIAALTVLSIFSSILSAEDGTAAREKLLRVYPVDKKVSDFPEEEDFSSPESAYATINRLSASGNRSFWPRVSVKRLAARMDPNQEPIQLPQETVNRRLGARIAEVRIFDGSYAMVAAILLVPEKTITDLRYFELEDGQWKNTGNDTTDDLDEARAKFDIFCTSHIQRPPRPGIDNPQAHLQPFIDFLKAHGRDPHAFVMDAMKEHKLLIMGELHHRPLYWAFNSSLVTDPLFADRVGVIYLELPANHQETVEAFLAAPTYQPELVVDVLRDMMWLGWPDQPILEFFETVWRINAPLPEDKKLRIVLADMPRPWEKVKTRQEWRQYSVDRDKYMAEQVLKDIENHPEGNRAGLFNVGIGHTATGFKFFGNHPKKTAGWHLTQALGDAQVYTIMQHRCVMTNNGRVDGRSCLGLFDSAFASLDNQPVAFTLEQGPFGEQPYDAQPDTHVMSTYRDGFNAYLFLGPLEDEIFSPLIPGFYTDDHVKELDRRFRMLHGRGWAEAYNIPKANAESFIDWMSGRNGSWGHPRKWTHHLGPIDAWVYGDEWEYKIRLIKQSLALEHPEEITQVASLFFDALRNADYAYHAEGRDWQYFCGDKVDYRVRTNFPGWVKWVCRTFSDNPIKQVELGKVFKSDNGLPAVPYTVTLDDGRTLEGELPFEYSARSGIWTGVEGVDWHLQNQN